jgi:hypothetical protein
MSPHLNARKNSSADDWMQVLDNFLDNDEAASAQLSRNDHSFSNITHAHNENTSINSHSPVGHNMQHPNHQNESASCKHESNEEPVDAQTQVAKSSSNTTTSTSSVTSNKNTDDIDPNLSEDTKAQIRSERKRNREKQRRSDVNNQFAALTDLLQSVEGYDLDSDVSDDEDECEPKKRKINSVGMVNVAPANRVDLIARTIAVMDRLHKVNRSLRQNVKDLRKNLKKCNGGAAATNSTSAMPGMMTNGMNMAMNGQMQGMMMMMPQQMASTDGQQQPMMMMVPMMMPNAMMQANGQGFVQGATMMGNHFQQQATQVQANNTGAQPHQQIQMQQQAAQQLATSNTHNGMNMMLTNPMGAFQGMHTMQTQPMSNNTFVQQNSNAAQVPVSTLAPMAHQQQQQTSTQQQNNMSSSTHSASGGSDQNVGNGDGSFTYGGNLAHCA